MGFGSASARKFRDYHVRRGRQVQNANPSRPGKLRPLWGGYLFLFEKSAHAANTADAGWRILVTCLLLEGLIRPALRSVIFGAGNTSIAWRGLALVAAMLLLAVAFTYYWIRIPLAGIGLHGWWRWQSTERWFFPQIMLIGLLVHAGIQWTNLCSLPRHPAWINATLLVVAWQLMWGFYQEYVYRGLLQTELVRRWGAVPGILVSNLFFTFGPLHIYHLWTGLNHPQHLLIFVAIFAIGLYFGVLFHASRNLWMIGILHGLGDFFIDGLPVLLGASIREGPL
jgi:membrane protease YdiL (CAAX protease family)